MSSLEFKELTLNNYRQYGGDQTIDLESSGGRINIIEGQNGAGKSNLLNAITLCFYGREEHQSDTDDEELESLPYVSRGLLEDIDVGGSVTGYVEVVLGTDRPEYIFRREFKTFKTEDGFSDTHGDLKLQRLVGTEWKEPDNPSTHLNQILPAKVADYFIFDGEDLNSFFDPGHNERVQDAILDVSHIELLNRALEHLEKVQSDIEGTATDLEGEAGQIRDEIEGVEDQISELKSECERIESDITDTETEIDRIDNRLKDVSDEYVRSLYDEREQLKEEVDRHEKRIEELTDDAVALMIEVGPMVYASEAFDYTLGVFNELSEKGQIPPKIQDWFIDELIERGTCICGTPLNDGGDSEDGIDHVQHLRDLQTDVEGIMEENLEGKSVIPRLQKEGTRQVDQLRDLRRRIAELEDEIARNKTRIQDITDNLKRYDIPDGENVDIENLEGQRESLEEQKENLQKELGRVEGALDNERDKKEGLETDLRRELQKESRYQDILTQLEFAEDAGEKLQDIKSRILSDIRSNTEASLEQYFNELIWKDEEYDIRLLDDYSVEVIDPHGDNKIGSLSAGEKQVLALSFMASLTRISGFNAPILIDTPLGRISSDPKRLIAKNLPKYVEDTQITFLMTDEEYTDEVRAMMESSLANEYQLEYGDTVTKVVSR